MTKCRLKRVPPTSECDGCLQRRVVLLLEEVGAGAIRYPPWFAPSFLGSEIAWRTEVFPGMRVEVLSDARIGIVSECFRDIQNVWRVQFPLEGASEEGVSPVNISEIFLSEELRALGWPTMFRGCRMRVSPTLPGNFNFAMQTMKLPLRYRLADGCVLPDGLELDEATGTIAGIPAQECGKKSVTIHVYSDLPGGTHADLTLQLQVTGPVPGHLAYPETGRGYSGHQFWNDEGKQILITPDSRHPGAVFFISSPLFVLDPMTATISAPRQPDEGWTQETFTVTELFSGGLCAAIISLKVATISAQRFHEGMQNRRMEFSYPRAARTLLTTEATLLVAELDPDPTTFLAR